VIVVDASALLEVLLRTPLGMTVEARLLGTTRTLHAPHLLDVEVAQVVRRFALAGEIDGERAEAALDDLMAFPIRRHPHGLLLSRVLALQNNFSAYDAMYVALAEALDAALVTHDRRLATAARRHARVELV
jgi:predicted nucleic acid-binding protein